MQSAIEKTKKLIFRCKQNSALRVYYRRGIFHRRHREAMQEATLDVTEFAVEAAIEKIRALKGAGDKREIPAIYLLHGKGGSPKGTVRLIEERLRDLLPGRRFVRVAQPHGDPTVAAEASVEFLSGRGIERGALLVGVSLGGLVAARLQETGRSDLRVLTISSPTWADGVRLDERPANRIALYSSQDDVIAERVAEWPTLAALALDFPWLSHQTDLYLEPLGELIAAAVERFERP